MKNQKGITLIALIITIIVMLILVGVTINVALNGGLFNTADDATTKTEKHAIYDQIVGAMELTNNGTIKVAETYSAAETALENQGMDVGVLGTDGTFTVTGKRGTYTYKITETKIIMDPQESPEPPEEDIVIKTLTPLIGEPAMSLLGNYDETKKCYRLNSADERLKDIERVEIYSELICSLIRDPNTNKDYIVSVDDDSNFEQIKIQPEEKTKTIREGIVALSNLEDFNQGLIMAGYWFAGFEPIGEPIDINGLWSYNQGFENSDINSIILSNVDYFNNLDDAISLNYITGIEYIYVPVGLELGLWADHPVDRGFSFYENENADDINKLNKVEIDGQEYYELHWSELE